MQLSAGGLNLTAAALSTDRSYTPAPVAKKAVRARQTVRGRQARELIAHVDALAERLRPSRRPVDRQAAACSPQELFALNTIGRRERLTMTDLAAAMRVP